MTFLIVLIVSLNIIHQVIPQAFNLLTYSRFVCLYSILNNTNSTLKKPILPEEKLYIIELNSSLIKFYSTNLFKDS